MQTHEKIQSQLKPWLYKVEVSGSDNYKHYGNVTQDTPKPWKDTGMFFVQDVPHIAKSTASQDLIHYRLVFSPSYNH